mgnify:CR=1 FL=1
MNLHNLPEAVKLSNNLESAIRLLDALNDRRCGLSIEVKKDPDDYDYSTINKEDTALLLPDLVTDLIKAITTRKQDILNQIAKLQ